MIIWFQQAFNDKVVIARCLVQYWQIFSWFLIFCYYFTRLRAREISRKIWEIQKIPSKHLLVLKTSWRRLEDMSWRRLEDMSWRRFEDMSWRRLEDMSWRRPEDMSWRCLEDMSWRRLEDFMETNKILTGDICILIWG